MMATTLRERIGPIVGVRDVAAVTVLAVGGVGMAVAELVVAISHASGGLLAVVLAVGSLLCLTGAGLRAVTGAQWFFGVLALAFNAGGVYALDDFLCSGALFQAVVLMPCLALASTSTALMLALDRPDLSYPGVGGPGPGGGAGGGGGC